MKTRVLFTLFAVLIISVLMVGQALASGSWSNYNLTVPKMGLGSSPTNNVTKVNSADRAVVCSQSIGGNKILEARIEKLDNTIVAGYQTISSLQRREYVLSQSIAGQQYHARLYNGNLVDVQAIGWWSPDNPGACGF